jgi:hypothetical protein
VTDHTLLGEFLELHVAEELPVVDASGGLRRLWPAELLERWQPVFVDRDPSKRPDVVADWTRLGAHFAHGSIGAVVWDPPHASDWGATSTIGFLARYATDQLHGPEAVIELFAAFLDAVKTVLHPIRGTLLVKLADQVHDEVLQAQPFWLWSEALDRGWRMCDYVVRKRAQPPHNTTLTQRHIRRGETFWFVLHPPGAGEACPGGGIAVRRRCCACGETFQVRRTDQLTCGAGRCRKRLSRARVQALLEEETPVL